MEQMEGEARTKPLKPWFKIAGRDGYRSVKSQVKGLGAVDFSGKTVLDLGCAEGAISLHALDCGAKVVHGVERHDEYIEAAYVVCRGRNAVFWNMDLAEFHTKHPASGLMPRYDVILLLSVIHKLADPLTFLDYCATLSDMLIIRLPNRVLADPRSAPLEVDIQKHLADRFRLVREPKTCIEPVTDKREWMGMFERKA